EGSVLDSTTDLPKLAKPVRWKNDVVPRVMRLYICCQRGQLSIGLEAACLSQIGHSHRWIFGTPLVGKVVSGVGSVSYLAAREAEFIRQTVTINVFGRPLVKNPLPELNALHVSRARYFNPEEGR